MYLLLFKFLWYSRFILYIFLHNNESEVSLIYQQLLLKRKEFLEQEILNLQEKISLLPPGKLICTRNGKRFKWYHSLKHSCIYLPKSQESLAISYVPNQKLSLIPHFARTKSHSGMNVSFLLALKLFSLTLPYATRQLGNFSTGSTLA